ncbi:SURF1 family protein [Thalassovita sp.]|uniref:SURF1 family protein n=1 Tax=Thalassovita sp. TaxID=1979401 RepID=UPI002B2681F0|nr:SURF1 family protein [Thalassovita sp.]
MRRLIFPLFFGLLGAAVLIALGSWQVQRLHWKQGVLAEIEAHIHADPVALPADPDPIRDRFLPVSVTGTMHTPTLRVLVSQKTVGAGYRLITPMETTQGRRILVDRGFIRLEVQPPKPPTAEVTVTGNLHWPDERDSFTPENDRAENIWFARDVGIMAKELNTEPVMLIARSTSFDDGPVSPLPVGTEGIPNDHFEYAVTWYGLAAVWLAMLGLFLWRMYKSTRNPQKGTET